MLGNAYCGWIYNSHAVVYVQFHQPSYYVNESAGEVSVCLLLTLPPTITITTPIEVQVSTSDSTALGKWITNHGSKVTHMC